jgi:hypothetical protein
MRKNRSGQRGNEKRTPQSAPKPQPLGKPQGAAAKLSTLLQVEAAIAAIFTCSPLTRHLVMALQAGGVNATVMPSGTGAKGAVIVVPAADKEAAVEILLRKLNDPQSPQGVNEETVTVLTA